MTLLEDCSKVMGYYNSRMKHFSVYLVMTSRLSRTESNNRPNSFQNEPWHSDSLFLSISHVHSEANPTFAEHVSTFHNLRELISQRERGRTDGKGALLMNRKARKFSAGEELPLTTLIILPSHLELDFPKPPRLPP